MKYTLRFITLKSNNLPIVIVALFTISLLLYSNFIVYVLAQEPIFIENPYVISRSNYAVGNTLHINLFIGFKITGLGNKSVVAFLTTSDGSGSYLCTSSKQSEQKTTFSSINNTKLSKDLHTENGQISYTSDSPLQLNLMLKADQTNCPLDKNPIIMNAEFKNIELHLIYIDGSRLKINDLGDFNIPSIGRLDKPPSQFLK